MVIKAFGMEAIVNLRPIVSGQVSRFLPEAVIIHYPGRVPEPLAEVGHVFLI